MCKCDDHCGRWACKTWDTDPYKRGPVRERYKALCGTCWRRRDAEQPLRTYPVIARHPQWLDDVAPEA